MFEYLDIKDSNIHSNVFSQVEAMNVCTFIFKCCDLIFKSAQNP